MKSQLKNSKKHTSVSDKTKKDYWSGWGDFLGTGRLGGGEVSRISKEKVDEVLNELDRNWVFYKRWTESLIRTWFEERGVYKAKDPYIRSFFTNFIDLRKSVQGRKALIRWLKTRDFKKSFYNLSLGGQATLQQLLPNYEASSKTNKKKRLVIEEELVNAKDLLKELRYVKIPFTDENDPKVIYTRQLLFRSCYDPSREHSEVNKIKKEKITGNKFHDTVVLSFLKEYVQVIDIKLPKLWIAEETPSLMQKHIAYKLTQLNGFFNLSNQGSGKTLSAILTSLTIKSKYTLIICPNNIVNQWEEVLLSTVNNCIVSTGKEIHSYLEGVANFHVINYDKFSYSFSSQVVKDINRQKY